MHILRSASLGLPLLAFLIACGNSPPSATPASPEAQLGATASSTSDFVPGEVIVKFKSKIGALSPAGFKLEVARELSEQEFLMRFKPGNDASADTKEVLKALQADAEVQYAQFNFRTDLEPLLPPILTKLKGVVPVALCRLLQPNDPRYPEQWHYASLKLPDTWCKLTRGENSPRIAVLDTGKITHEDLKGVFVGGHDFVSDLDNNDGDGWDNDPTDPGNGDGLTPPNWHGAHVAGTIGANTDNKVGGAGVNWFARIVPVRVLGKNGGTAADTAKAIRYAAGLTTDVINANPVKVMNLSLGFGGADLDCAADLPAIQEAINAATNAGVSVVVSAGNANVAAERRSLANCAHVISVGSSTINNTRAFYSNFASSLPGTGVDVAAPGGETGSSSTPLIDTNNDGLPDGVLSTVLNDAGNTSTYGYKQGTSMAAPHVTGIISLMHAFRTTKHPEWPMLTPAQVERILKDTATPLPASEALGAAGLVNSFKAVERAGTVQNP